MTIYHRIRVWCIKGYRLLTNGFKWVRPREHNVIFHKPVIAQCDYCDATGSCTVLEADYEVYPVICADCLRRALLQAAPETAFTVNKVAPDYLRTGIVVH